MKELSKRFVTFETLITFLTVENSDHNIHTFYATFLQFYVISNLFMFNSNLLC